MLTVQATKWIMIGIITMYAHDAHVGNPLRCGGTYTTDHAWAAMDIDAIPGLECGHLILVCAAGECQELQVMDSGPLSRYCVRDGDVCRPIVADLPEHVAWFPGLSAQGRVVNLTQVRERMEVER